VRLTPDNLPHIELIHADTRVGLADAPDATFGSCVTDPPYELVATGKSSPKKGYMNQQWDGSGIAFDPSFWAEVLRVLKPGAHLVAFGAPRTYHRLACAIEDAGFEIRDSLHWCTASGFPKSMNVAAKLSESDLAAAFDGWGTALKPAHEPIVLARRPIEGSVAATIAAHGTGAINIDACRVLDGRWPPNVLVTHDPGCGEMCVEGCVVAEVDGGPSGNISRVLAASHWDPTLDLLPLRYVPKPSRSERDAGLEHLTPRRLSDRAHDDRPGGDNPRNRTNTPRLNFHPTVKPVEVMRWLVRLVTPPGERVLEPFAGSGTTLMASVIEGFDATGFELTGDFLPIIEGRVNWAVRSAGG
jgi:site-specific DNA-methyltransferase (adenine-specific)